MASMPRISVESDDEEDPDPEKERTSSRDPKHESPAYEKPTACPVRGPPALLIKKPRFPSHYRGTRASSRAFLHSLHIERGCMACLRFFVAWLLFTNYFAAL